METCYRCKNKYSELESDTIYRYRLLCRNCAWDALAADEVKEKKALTLSRLELIDTIRKCEIKIYHLPKPLLSDYELVMECFSLYEGEDIDDNIFIALQYFFENEKTNLSLLKKIVLTDGFSPAFAFGPTSLRNDREIALHIINDNSIYMRWASPSLRSDKSLALQWVKSVEDLEYLSEELQKDPEIMKAATKSNRTIDYRSPITGDDIMKAFGLTPGEKVGKLLASLKKEILDGRIPNAHNEAMKFIDSIKDEI